MPADLPAGSNYTRLTFKRQQIVTALALLLIPFSLLSLSIGSYKLTTGEILTTLLSGSDDSLINHLLWNIRLPRTVAALLAGAGLALAGAVMQNLLRNPLAAPSTLGVSQGAAFGAACAIILLGSGQTFTTGNEGVLLTSRNATALAAFGGALFSVAVILAIATFRQLAAEAMILAGVAVGAFLSSCTMLLQYFASDLQVAATLFWTFGDLGKAGWPEHRLIALLLQRQMADRALAALRRCRELEPAFRPPEASLEFALAEAAHRQHESRLALELMRAFDKRHPGHPLIPDVYFLSARILCEEFRQDATAEKIFASIISRYPQHPCASRAEEYRQTLSRLRSVAPAG